MWGAECKFGACGDHEVINHARTRRFLEPPPDSRLDDILVRGGADDVRHFHHSSDERLSVRPVHARLTPQRLAEIPLAGREEREACIGHSLAPSVFGENFFILPPDVMAAAGLRHPRTHLRVAVPEALHIELVVAKLLQLAQKRQVRHPGDVRVRNRECRNSQLLRKCERLEVLSHRDTLDRWVIARDRNHHHEVRHPRQPNHGLPLDWPLGDTSDHFRERGDLLEKVPEIPLQLRPEGVRDGRKAHEISLQDLPRERVEAFLITGRVRNPRGDVHERRGLVQADQRIAVPHLPARVMLRDEAVATRHWTGGLAWGELELRVGAYDTESVFLLAFLLAFHVSPPRGTQAPPQLLLATGSRRCRAAASGNE